MVGRLLRNSFRITIMHLFLTGKSSLLRRFIFILMFVVVSIILFHFYIHNSQRVLLSPRSVPYLSFLCNNHKLKTISENNKPVRIEVKRQLLPDSKLLLILKTRSSMSSKTLIILLESARISYQIHNAGYGLPYLTEGNLGRYSLIIFENFANYLMLQRWNRKILDNYCRDYGVGVVGFMPSSAEDNILKSDGGQYYTMGDFPLYLQRNASLRDYYLSGTSPLLRVTKQGTLLESEIVPSLGWTSFTPIDNDGYDALAFSERTIISDIRDDEFAGPEKDEKLARTIHEISLRSIVNADSDTSPVFKALVIHDLGKFDNIERVIFGSPVTMWLNYPLFSDVVSYFTRGKLAQPLDRYILIDIDDIFVGKTGTRLHKEDVDEILKAQKKWSKFIPNFKFNLGFSGKFYQRGTPEENAGDEHLIANRQHFSWFGHLWNHMQPHKAKTNVSLLKELMQKNFNFAQAHDIPTNSQYSIAPHHSGVYPIYQPLYDAWSKIWNIKATATEQYPRFNPARYRRGFIHNGIMVLPRQTCGIYTHTIFLDKYPHGPDRLQRNVLGGELFVTLLYNPVAVFMTHMSNYGGDRLALYTFDAAFRFLRCWTNYNLLYDRPVMLARRYFEKNEKEVQVIWKNPCADKRHRLIWPEIVSCRLPDFMILGPQKTGTTALSTFLALHPQIIDNFPNPQTYEEVQFFNGKNYHRGLNWYLNQFPPGPTKCSLCMKNSSSTTDYNGDIQVFEKSATYFDSDKAPFRAHELLPKTRLIIVLISPAKRAYSWYQHMRSHKNPFALNHTFMEVITATGNVTTSPLMQLKRRCLLPGYYAKHLEQWRTLYSLKQMHIVDGDELRVNPFSALDKVQDFLTVEQKVDYSKLLTFNSIKGFYCLNNDGLKEIDPKNIKKTKKCLGRGKGRSYPKMDENAINYLRSYYRKPNVALYQFLRHHGISILPWLKEELSN